MKKGVAMQEASNIAGEAETNGYGQGSGLPGLPYTHYVVG